MNILEIIDKKAKGEELSKEELKFVVDGFLNETIKDYQMSAFLMEVKLLGFTENETIDFTDIMLKSGNVLNLDVDNLVDKHSTGGVGDKVTIVLAPLIASLGLNIAKMSGRGLGHTGGTIDKLEAIKGFKTSMSLEKFEEQVKNIGIALTGQMENLVPADKKIYALRDVTSTVDSVPLIASSIMSKKLALGANTIVIDLKVGKGALIKSIEDAKLLGELMVKIGKMNGKKIACILTNMDEPLGFSVGNSLEVLEAIETLKGNGPDDLVDITIALASHILSLCKQISLEEAKKLCTKNLENGKAYDKFMQWINAQGASGLDIDVAKNVLDIYSEKDGYIKEIDALRIGNLSRKLGAGRLNKEDKIDLEVGIVLRKKVGDKVKRGEKLLSVFYNEKQITTEEALSVFEISKEFVNRPKQILGIVK